MKTSAEIHNLYLERRKRLGPIHAKALEIRNIIYGDIALPLPEMDRSEAPAVANVALLGLEQTAMRTASTLPTVLYPILRPGIKKSEEAARDRQQVNLWWWTRNRFGLKMMKRARHLHAYTMSPVLIMPDPRYDFPCWHIRDPLQTFPAEMETGEVVPDDCLFLSKRPFGWVKNRYPDQAGRVAKAENTSPDVMFDVLEYVDADEFQTVVIGQAQDNVATWAGGRVTPGEPSVTLEQIENRAGRSWAVVPGRVSLDQPQGQFDGLIGMYQMQAKLMALELLGMERAIFPETWVVSTDPSQDAHIVTQADPVSGVVGRIRGGTISNLRIEPSALGTQFVDRLERNQRVMSGTPAEFGGEASSNIRTGRRGDQVLSATVDFQIQTAHLILEESMEEENRIAIAIDKAYYNTPKTFVISPTKGQLTYTPSDLWETDDNVVKYSHAGMDAATIPIAGGQRVGIGAMSIRTLQELDPLIDDPELEGDRIVAEGLERGVLQGLEAAAADPAMLVPIAQILSLVKTNKMDFVDAFLEVHSKMQEQQTQAQAGELAPEQVQPGIAEPTPTIPEQPGGLQNLSFLLQSLKGQRGAA